MAKAAGGAAPQTKAPAKAPGGKAPGGKAQPRKADKTEAPATPAGRPKPTGETPPRMRDRFRATVVPALMKERSYPNPFQVPRVDKIVINMGVGEGRDNAKALDFATADLQLISGQKPIVTRAKKSIANFKLREGSPIGAKVTLRGA